MINPLSLKAFAVSLCLLPLLAGCKDNAAEAQAVNGSNPPPVQVSIVTVKAETLPIVNELPGRIAPTRIAEVRPRVSGIIIERVFEQGSMVSRGDVLYRIDPAPFEVEKQRAEAAVARARAVLLQARQEAERQSELVEENITSRQAYENAKAAEAQAEAEVAAARAALAAAELNLAYSQVRAPIDGRIGRALITEGALVGVGTGENLATIQQLDPVYADFTQSAGELLRLRRALDAGSLMSADPGEAKVELLLDDGTRYPHPGRLLFSEAAVDAMTGQVTLRAEFPNPEGDLLPGMYVRVLVEQGIRPNAIAIPQQAVQRDAGGQAQVYVVDGDGSATLRTISTGRTIGNRWIVEEGLNVGDRVVVEGFQKIRPGAQVTVQEWSPQTAEGETTVSVAANAPAPAR